MSSQHTNPTNRHQPMAKARLMSLTVLALLAFAGNSLLCRLALATTSIDAATFTSIRLLSGVVTLLLICAVSARSIKGQGTWLSAVALFSYAAGFSFAYLTLPTGLGALLLFGAVQTSMIGFGLWRGERFSPQQLFGLLLALVGLIGLMLPGVSAPPLGGALLMVLAGVSWGVYSLRGRGSGDAISLTYGNFMRAFPLALLLSLWMIDAMSVPLMGVAYAVISGALASAVGYAIWYSVLPYLAATKAATLQLSVPVIAAFAGVIVLDEAVTTRLLFASLAILGGIGLVVYQKQPTVKPS